MSQIFSHRVCMCFAFWPFSLTSTVAHEKRQFTFSLLTSVFVALLPGSTCGSPWMPGTVSSPCLESDLSSYHLLLLTHSKCWTGQASTTVVVCPSAAPKNIHFWDTWHIPLMKEFKATFLSSCLILLCVVIGIVNNNISLFSLNLGFQSW